MKNGNAKNAVKRSGPLLFSARCSRPWPELRGSDARWLSYLTGYVRKSKEHKGRQLCRPFFNGK